MSLFWYPEINDKFDFEKGIDKGMLLSSYVRYFLARLQSMFIYEGLPDSIPAKWLENYLLVNGSCVFIETDKGLIVTRAGIGGQPDEYYIPTECIVTNPYIQAEYNKVYKRDENCVLMVNDTYAQGLLPMIKKYCAMLVENDITMNIADIMSRASLILSAADDQTRESAELFIKRLFEGKLSVIGETPFLVANQDKALSIEQLSGANQTITNLIEYHQYLKASLYNELGLNSNYNMKRESINSGESQLNDDMLHPLIDNMLKERQEGLERVNKMFNTNITVKFNSAWMVNEREEQAAIESLENEGDGNDNIDNNNDTNNDMPDNSGNTAEDTEIETIEETSDETETVEVTISENAIEEIAEKVAENLDDETEKEGEDNAEDKA